MNGQSLLRRFSILVPLVLALPVGAAEIVARISHDTVSIGQPFSLFLEAQGEVESPPDLSVLHEAFEILGRSQRHNVKVINGRSIRRASLTLTLSPTIAGKLTIPSISFGNARSQPIALEVMDGYLGTQPEWQEPHVLGPSGGYLPTPQISEKTTASQPQTPTQSIAVDDQPAGATNVWPWVAFILALGWALTVGVCVVSRIRRGQNVSAHVKKDLRAEPTPQTPPSALDVAQKHLEHACSSRDAERTKSALLIWARHLWPEDPPSNLSSLARRCPPDIGKGILEFERMLYSPETEPWFDLPVWKRLTEISALEGKKSASEPVRE